jgi:hypothetical protein
MALSAAAAEGVCIHHPKFAALAVCEFNPDYVHDEHELVRTLVGRLRACRR